MKIKIISDSTCDLSNELIEKYDISIVPLHVVMDEVSYDDYVNVTPEQIYEWSDRTKKIPGTAAPSIGEVEEVLKGCMDDYDGFILFSIASGMSSSNQVMHMAVNDLELEDRALVIDSQNLSTGIGLLVIRACELARRGKDLNRIAAEIEELIPKVRSSFVVDTLTYLYRGGRCSGVAALAGSALKLHPLITVENGKMAPGKKYRGKMEHVFLNYVEDLREKFENADRSRVFLTHSGCSEQILEQIRDILTNGYGFEEVLTAKAHCVISTHCGPNTLGVIFIEN